MFGGKKSLREKDDMNVERGPWGSVYCRGCFSGRLVLAGGVKGQDPSGGEHNGLQTKSKKGRSFAVSG